MYVPHIIAIAEGRGQETPADRGESPIGPMPASGPEANSLSLLLRKANPKQGEKRDETSSSLRGWCPGTAKSHPRSAEEHGILFGREDDMDGCVIV
jgi:hypothetical protein